ncbi:MAG: hypothetical protein IT348_19630 [Candidatus Eisenbacteria bacterium]|nr:hypothetical protein [Candidatus Eisenbacteria bacterium]
MHLTRTAFQIHRLLSYVAFAQMLAWIGGGVVFSLIPFDSVVKGGAVVEKPTPRLPGEWRESLSATMPRVGEVSKLETFAGPHGTAFRVRGDSGQAFVPADGSPWRAPDSAGVARWARALYRGGGELSRVSRIERARPLVGIVQEAGERRDLWRANFSDRLHTRFYFDGPSGEFLMVRNDAWVLYDFFFRLHVMDYAGGEDFNNLLLRAFAVLSLAFAISGAVLTYSAARRALLASRRGRSSAGPTTHKDRSL